jgi:hypothetical protein
MRVARSKEPEGKRVSPEVETQETNGVPLPTDVGSNGRETVCQEERDADIAEPGTLQQMARAQRERLRSVEGPFYDAASGIVEGGRRGP